MQLTNIQNNVDLFPHTTLRMRSAAEHFFIAKSRQDIIDAQNFTKENSIPLTILGGGSNVALISKVVSGLVVKNIYMKREILKEDENYADVSISSGYPVTKLINESVEAGHSGLEYHLGLPGTVGGAIYMNSKWTNPECYFGDPLVRANLLTKEGEIKTVERDYFKFRYDYSILHETGEILLEAILRFKKENPEVLKKRADDAQEFRKKTQPVGVASSGCFFQNITEEEREKIGEHTKSAGNLIDKAGLKGYKIGNFVVSLSHGNFIINQGDGDPDHLSQMLNTVKSKVKERFGIELREEVVVI